VIFMLFRSGVTVCPACDRPLDATDDAIALQGQAAAGAQPLPEAGFYHRDCLLALPQHAECVRAFRAQVERQFNRQKQIWRILHFDWRFALAYVPDLEAARLCVFAECRELSVRCDRPWRELVDLVLCFESEQAHGPDPGRLPFTSISGNFWLERRPDRSSVLLNMRNGVVKNVRFTAADMARLAAARPDALEVGRRVDFARLAQAFGLDPQDLGPADRARGVVTEVVPGRKRSTIRYVAERWLTIGLPLADFEAFRAMLAVHV
jgi:hypothetical protein